MAKIHMETEEVRYLAQSMARQADRFMEKSESLSRACGRLSGAWMGGSRPERYLSKLRGLAKKLESQSYALQQLSIRVNREVDEWVSADSDRRWISIKKAYVPGLAASSIPILMAGTTSTTSASNIAFKGFIGYEKDFDPWSPSDLLDKQGFEKKADVKLPVVEGSLYDADDATWSYSMGGITQSYRGDIKAGDYEAGLKFGLGEKGFTAGFYGEYDSVKASGTSVIGSAALGVTSGITATALSADGFIGVRNNDFGAKIGASLASVELEQGLNIAGINIGMKVGLSAGVEFGFQLGDDSSVNFGPFKVGLSFGKAVV